MSTEFKKYYTARIVKHTPLIVQNDLTDCWHKNMIGKIIRVTNGTPGSGFYEVNTGESILKTDVEILPE